MSESTAGSDLPPSYPPSRSVPAREDRTTERAPRASRWTWLKETVLVMASALVLSVVIKTFLAQAFYIPSGSMEDTLELGDRVMVNKLVPEPVDLQRGDVVVFLDPGGWLDGLPPDDRPEWQQRVTQVLTWVGLLPQDAGHHLIKRVIGTEGDRVSCCAADGEVDGAVEVNGVPLDEPYLRPGVEPSTQEFDVEVPAGHVWLMGDNRSNSADSRAHLGDPGGGMVPVDNIVGRAFIVLWPLERVSLLGSPEETFTGVPDAAP